MNSLLTRANACRKCYHTPERTVALAVLRPPPRSQAAFLNPKNRAAALRDVFFKNLAPFTFDVVHSTGSRKHRKTHKNRRKSRR